MAIEKLINHSQGEDIKTALNTIATNIQTVGAVSLETLGMGFTTCSTEQATAAKTATLTGYTIADGGIVSVKFSNAVDAGATLNINSQGAKPIYYKGAAITNSIINAGAIATFVYSNNQYQLINLDTDVEQVQTNKNNILWVEYGNHDISMLGEFAIGGLEPDGTLKPKQTARVSSINTITTPPYDITLLLSPDYRVGYIPFVDGVPGEWVNWAYNSMTIPASTTLKFQIGRPLETGITANVTDYVRAVKIIPTAKPAITTIDGFTFGRGVITLAGDIGADSTNVYTSAIDVKRLDRVIISASNNYKFGWHTYDEKFKSIDNAAAFTTTPTEIDVSNVSYIRINVKRLDDATLNLDEVSNIKLKITNISQFADTSKIYSYSGNVNISNTYAVKNFTTYTPTSSSLPSTTQQGMSIYNGKAFLLYNKGGLAIYDLINKQSIAEITLASASADNHCNSCNFSTEIISGGIYPLLYISECYGQHRCFVENITNLRSTLVQTITFSNENGDYTNSTYNNAFDWILDNDTGMLMTYGLMSDGKHKIKMFAKPSTSNATVTLGETDVIDEWIVEDYIYPALSNNYTYQGNCAKGGIIYLLTGQSNEIICISEDTHAMTARVPLTYDTTGEPEDLAIYADTMFVVYGDKKIYGMSFD